MEKMEMYRKKATEFATKWDVNNDHIIHIISSVMMTRDKYLEGGDFVQAVCRNDLRSAVARADKQCSEHLKVIALAYTDAHL